MSVTKKYKVLFLCRENSARSIIAEALLRELAGHRFDAFSAGPEPAAGVHPSAIAQLRPGISDLGVLSPKSWLEFTGEWAPRMDLVIAMDACVAGHHAPRFPGDPALCSWNFADPLADGMLEPERVRSFEKEEDMPAADSIVLDLTMGLHASEDARRGRAAGEHRELRRVDPRVRIAGEPRVASGRAEHAAL